MADKKKISKKEELLERAQTEQQISDIESISEEETSQHDNNGSSFLDFKPKFNPGEIVEQPIVKEMKSNYLDYSMSVIVARALPESKDGLKPSQRRILVAMKDLNLQPTANYRKSAKIAGDTSGNYHPHGEMVIYPTMVKLAQKFATRYPLVDGQGNFGTIDGDPPAAMRYTEARMTRVTNLMLQDLEKGTVTFTLNYDGTRVEPDILPTLFPNLVCNGSDGIAVGMATKIPPHNLREVVGALHQMIKKGNKWQGNAIYNELRLEREKEEKIPQALNSTPADYFENYVNTSDPDYETKVTEIKTRLNESPEEEAEERTLYPEFSSAITPDELIEIVPGPDFPTGGTIYNRKDILDAYTTGRGRVLMRAKASIVDGEKGRMHILVTEIPYQVNKSTLLTKIADLVKDKKVTGIADLRDESNLKEGIRIVVILKKDAQPKTVLNKLYKYTQMQMAFNANMLSLVDQEPQTLSLKRMLEIFLSFRMTVTIRRYEYDLAQARYRGHILEGYLKALDVIDEIISTIRGSKTQEEAKDNLITKFEFTEVQAQAILDMQLRRLAALEREKLENEFKDVTAKIKEYNQVLSSQEEVLKVIDQELKEMAEKYGDDRRTKVVKGNVDEIAEEDLVPDEETFVSISHEGYIKRLPPSTYKAQHRGGKGVMGAATKEEDFIKHAFSCRTHDNLLLFTNKGRVFKTKVYEVPEYSRTAKGLPLVNLIQLDQDELVTSVLTQDKEGFMSEDAIQEKQDKSKVVDSKTFKYLFMATEAGLVKKTDIKDFEKIRSSGLIAIKLDDGDQLQWVTPTDGDDDVILVTTKGRSIRFSEKDVRPTGRATRGVRGIRFKFEDDKVISMNAVRANENQLFTLSEQGYGKMTKLDEYGRQGRGGSGIYTFRVTAKTGNVVVARVLDHPDAEIFVVSEKGQVIRSEINSIPTLGRQTSGVKVMSTKKGDKVSAMAIL
ncbi:DNA gyrase subunit A [Candidatus Nomurabacteria bacterium]|nr:DNA gyrase subunit A [Candidatus Nomurabacteria bacterium]